MRDVIRRIGVCLFVVAFVFSGATWAACGVLPAAQAAVSPAVPAHAHQNVAAADHGTYQNGESSYASVAPDQGPLPDHSHTAAVKCCSMAPVVSLSPNLSATLVIFSAAAISFRTAQRDLTGFIVALDPGIPKSIV